MPIPEILCFVCTNHRRDDREGCDSTHDSSSFLQELKDELKRRGLKPRIRATRSGCLGRCKDGPFGLVAPSMEYLQGFNDQDVFSTADYLEDMLS